MELLFNTRVKKNSTSIFASKISIHFTKADWGIFEPTINELKDEFFGTKKFSNKNFQFKPSSTPSNSFI
ncbi:MAG TPA: hypothetical protein DCQ93_00670 [Bacteroidetes bacterium]|nr:hypothetical protein [Bacteroidota bacterium]